MFFERLVVTGATPEEQKRMEATYWFARTHALEADRGEADKKQNEGATPTALPKALYPTYGLDRTS